MWRRTRSRAHSNRRLIKRISRRFCRNIRVEEKQRRTRSIRATSSRTFWSWIKPARSVRNRLSQQIDQIACKPTGGRKRIRRSRTASTPSSRSRSCRRANGTRRPARRRRSSRQRQRGIPCRRRLWGWVARSQATWPVNKQFTRRPRATPTTRSMSLRLSSIISMFPTSKGNLWRTRTWARSWRIRIRKNLPKTWNSLRL